MTDQELRDMITRALADEFAPRPYERMGVTGATGGPRIPLHIRIWNFILECLFWHSRMQERLSDLEFGRHLEELHWERTRKLESTLCKLYFEINPPPPPPPGSGPTGAQG